MYRNTIIAILAIAVLSVACGQQKSARRTNVDIRSGRNTGLVGQTPNDPATQQPGNTNLLQGTLNTNTQMVRKFFAPGFRPEEIGEVGPNSVKMYGAISVNGNAQNGTVNGQQSMIKVVVCDSFCQSGQGDLSQSLDAALGMNIQGQIQNNQITVDFNDEFSSVRLTGVINGNTVTGQISFINHCELDSAGLYCTEVPQQQMSLGNFTIPTCSLIRCQ